MKQFIHVTLRAHNKIKSKLSISNEPPFLVKHKALLSSRGTDNILTLKGNNDKREKKKRMVLWRNNKSWYENTKYILMVYIVVFLLHDY